MDNILNYWYEMEYFNPCWPVDVKSDIDLKKIKIPWPMVEEEPNNRSTFDVYIGKTKTEELIQWMIDKLNLPAEEKIEHDNSISCLCALKVDAKGKYVPDSFAISSFIWAICNLTNSGFNSNLDHKEFNNLQESFNKKLTGEKDLEPVFVSYEILNNIFGRICKNININPNLILYTLWAKKKVQWGWKKNKESNEYVFPSVEVSTELTSSFYLKDLKKISINPVKRIRKYICAMNSLQNDVRIQIDTNVEEMIKWTAVDKYPLGIWPSAHHPSLMQQIAINLAISNEQDFFSVNGPPGTGKTTLLKEIIVSNIIERAKVLSKYNNPDNAFTCEKITNPPDNFNSTFYIPDKELTAFGIVVASNNNAAVENISVELPKKIKENRSGRFTIDELNTEDTDIYFSDIATNMLMEPAWGLISAKLGKRSNLKQLLQSLWWSQDAKNLRDYYNDVIKIPDWKTSKDNFNVALNCVLNSRIEITRIQKKFLEYRKLQKDFLEMEHTYSNSIKSIQNLYEDLNNLRERIARLQSLKETKQKNIGIIKKEISLIKKWLWPLFKSNPLIIKLKLIESEIQDIIIEITKQYDLQQEKELLLFDLQKENEEYKNKLEQLQLLYDNSSVEINQYKSRFGKSITDDKFWENIEVNDFSQEISPWTDNVYDKQREELFYQALMLHKAFILNSNAVKQNLLRLSAMWDDKFIWQDRKLAYGSLLNTLLILIPVISTTFASVEAFMDEIGPEELGLLVIDESGQATPQSALGAIWRTKKVIIVGDPLQVEPIVTIPKELQIKLANKNCINSDYRISELSVQMMGDRLNHYGGIRTFEGQQLWIGCPLVLHRRCINPMFKISNQVAYNNRMIQKTSIPKTGLCLSMEESFWYDIKGKMKEKGNQNVKEQNDVAISLLQKALQSCDNLPDIYLITPFRKVSDEIRKKLIPIIKKNKPKIEESEIKDWINTHCGTIHTFQGKEANEVILVLGCDSAIGSGAARWVGQKPNIINVAVSRAKYRICIVGDYDQWIKTPNVCIACKHLKRVSREL